MVGFLELERENQNNLFERHFLNRHSFGNGYGDGSGTISTKTCRRTWGTKCLVKQFWEQKQINQKWVGWSISSLILFQHHFNHSTITFVCGKSGINNNAWLGGSFQVGIKHLLGCFSYINTNNHQVKSSYGKS